MNAEDCPVHRDLIDRAGAAGIYYPWTCECEPETDIPRCSSCGELNTVLACAKGSLVYFVCEGCGQCDVYRLVRAPG
jgi:hypothetical protein